MAYPRCRRWRLDAPHSGGAYGDTFDVGSGCTCWTLAVVDRALGERLTAFHLRRWPKGSTMWNSPAGGLLEGRSERRDRRVVQWGLHTRCVLS